MIMEFEEIGREIKFTFIDERSDDMYILISEWVQKKEGKNKDGIVVYKYALPYQKADGSPDSINVTYKTYRDGYRRINKKRGREYWDKLTNLGFEVKNENNIRG
jgi:hypothetical protein